MRSIGKNNFIICLGDDIRYKFAQELMPDGQIIDTNSFKISKSYIFMFSSEENIITDDKKVVVYTSKIREGRVLEFPVSGVDVKTIFSDQNNVRIGKILIFADFPYNKENLHYLVDKTCREASNADISLVLYNEKRRTGYTDMQKSGEIITESYNEFGSFGIRICEYFSKTNKSEIITVKPDNLNFFKKKYLKELDGAQYRLDNRFDIHYKTFLERTYELYFSFNNPDEFARFVKLFEFGNIDKNTRDIWDTFKNDFVNMYLDSDSYIMNEISGFYLDYICEILNFRLNDESNLIKQLAVNLFDECFKEHLIVAACKNELDFKELLNKNNIITEFTKRIEDFFYIHLKQMLYAEADKRLNFITNFVHADFQTDKNKEA